MHTIRSVLLRKGGEIFSVWSGDSALDAIRLMAAKSIGALLVIDDGELVGTRSERDYARKVILKGVRSDATAVHDIMVAEPVTMQGAATGKRAARSSSRHWRPIRWRPTRISSSASPCSASPGWLAIGKSSPSGACSRRAGCMFRGRLANQVMGLKEGSDRRLPGYL